MHSLARIALLLATIALANAGCTAITVETPLLSDANSSRVRLEPYYEIVSLEDGEKRDPNSVIPARKGTNANDKRAWYSADDEYRVYARRIKHHWGDEVFLVQLEILKGELTSKDRPTILLSLALPGENGRFIVYKPNTSAIAKATDSEALRPLKDHFSKDDKSTLRFDRIAVEKSETAIIDFLRSLDDSDWTKWIEFIPLDEKTGQERWEREKQKRKDDEQKRPSGL